MIISASLIFSTLLAAASMPEPVMSTAADGSLGRDFHIGHTGWNGLSRLGGLSRDLGCAIDVRRTLDWSTLEGRDLLFIVHPESPIDPDSALAYLTAGGRLIVADDYGQSDKMLARLGVVRHTGPVPAGTLLYRNNVELPIATPLRATQIGRAAYQLIGNHSAFFTSGLPATYGFAPGADLVVEGTLGRGRFVAIADSSLFINNMLEIGGNRDFLARLIVELCRPQRDRLVLIYGPFLQHGTPPTVLLGAPSEGNGADFAEQWNRALTSANSHIQETLKKRGSGGLDVMALCGLLFCVGALALLLRYLPMPVPPQDERFAQPPRPAETGLHASITRYTDGSGQAVGWGYVYPATLLREEVLTRLQPFLVELPRLEPMANANAFAEQVRALLSEKLSPRGGEIAGILVQEFRRLDRTQKNKESVHPSQAHISARALRRWYDLAVELFAELDAKQTRKRAHG